MMGMRKRMKDNRGFTLVELIVATSVLAIIMTPLLRMFVMAGNTIRSSSDFGLTTVAMENAQELVLGAEFLDLEDTSAVEEALKGLSPNSSSTEVTVNEIDNVTNADGVVDMVKYGVTNLKTGHTGGHIEVTLAKITNTTDTDSIHYNALYGGVNDTDFSSFTAMDLTMVQPGFVSNDAGDVEINRSAQVDFRSAATNSVVNGVGANLKDVQRIIRVTLKQKDKTVGSTDKYQMVEYSTVYEYYKHNGSSDASTYLSSNILESKEIFSGESYIGSDDVFSVQLVYFPLYNQRDLIVVETSNASTEKADFGVKFFMIKQDVVGFEHPFLVDASGNNEIVVAGSPSESYSEYYYSAYVYLDDVDDHFALYTNIHYDVSGLYTTPISSDFRFYSKDSGSYVYESLTSKLVANSDDSRGFNILVEAFDKEGNPVNQMMKQMTTVKLN